MDPLLRKMYLAHTGIILHKISGALQTPKSPSLRISAGTSLVAQWLRIRLPMQGTRLRALVREDPTWRGATKPVHHSYLVCALEPTCHNY